LRGGLLHVWPGSNGVMVRHRQHTNVSVRRPLNEGCRCIGPIGAPRVRVEVGVNGRHGDGCNERGIGCPQRL
jgi:hypothetical protein